MLLMPLMLLLSASSSTAWEALPALPEPNGGGVYGVLNSKIVVLGGTHWEGGIKNWLTAAHEFDPATRQWRTLPGGLQSPVAYGLALQSASSFGFVGGTDGKHSLKVLGSMEKEAVHLHPMPALPATLVLAAGGQVGRRIILTGGTDDPANIAGITRSTWAVENGEVKALAHYPGKPFAVGASAVMDDELFIFGGMNYDTASQAPVNASAAYAFLPSNNTWRALAPLQKANRGLAAVALDDQHIYLAGGFTDAFTADAVIYETKANVYKPSQPLPYAAMVALVKCGDYIYCVGGEDKMKSRTDKFYRIPVKALLP